jgi:hypothetical protein
MTLVVLDVDDDASAVTTATTTKEFAKFAPRNAPFSWLVINTVLFIWSLLLVIEVTMDSTLKPLERTHLYLVWNFGTTFCWCAELVLTVLANAQEANRTNGATGDSWATILELVLAIYFTSDSIHLFRKWRKADQDIIVELLDATLTTLAYFYAVLKAKPLTLLASKDQHRKYELIV